ncbi:MAG TPA: O-succinylhomoserine sulfhydrylase [Crenotrichaceae bacterium]|nr:O-succinylhomoserine sulfhydrylase [Crenotrichaceae bacterium]
MNKKHPDYSVESLAIRAGQQRTAEGEHSDAIFPTSSFVFDNAAQAAARFSHQEEGNIYSRFTNPTVRTFEQRLAAMEGGERCVAFASGMAAILALGMGLLENGAHVVCSRSLFGTSVLLFQNIMGKFGVETTFVDLTNISAWQQAITPKTRFLFLETPSNPLTHLADIKELASLAHHHDCLLVVDNVYCTPVLQQPLALGADLVVHSATKYIDGQGRCIGGAIVGSEELLNQSIYPFLRTAGPTMSPFNAWVFLTGLETLAVRMQAHCANALQLARWLEEHPAVTHVYYPGLSSHPQYTLGQQQQSGSGGVLSFEVAGGKQAAWKVIDGTQMLSITANLGDVKTTITHPATTTHGRLTDEERKQAGISDGLIRISVGLEQINDIKNDLIPGLDT